MLKNIHNEIFKLLPDIFYEGMHMKAINFFEQQLWKCTSCGGDNLVSEGLTIKVQ